MHSVPESLYSFRFRFDEFPFPGPHFRFGGHWISLSVPPPVSRTSLLAPNLRRAGQIRNLEALKSDFWWLQSLGTGQELLIIFVMGESV